MVLSIRFVLVSMTAWTTWLPDPRDCAGGRFYNDTAGLFQCELREAFCDL